MSVIGGSSSENELYVVADRIVAQYPVRRDRSGITRSKTNHSLDNLSVLMY
jgi:hypothetical protein